MEKIWIQAHTEHEVVLNHGQGPEALRHCGKLEPASKNI